MAKHGHIKRDRFADDNDFAPETEELDFHDNDVARPIGTQQPQDKLDREQPAERVEEAGLTEAAFPEGGPTADDMTPETLLNTDGARSPNENGGDTPADEQLSEVEGNAIGGGRGLDEAELGRKKPLDGEPWDGDPDEPLGG